MKAKQWLKDNGHIKEVGRGRISLENHARLKAAHDSGVEFSDWPKGKVTTTVATPDKPAVARVEKVVSESGVKVVSDLVFRYDEREWFAQAADGTKFGMREVCQPCGYSLVGHQCDKPIVLGKPVVIKRAK